MNTKAEVQKEADQMRQIRKEASEVGHLLITKVSRQVSDKVICRDMRALNELELTSIYGLLAYVAENQDVAQETVQAIVEAQFGVNNVTKIKQRDYEEAIRFLVDLRIDEMKN